VKIDDLLAAGPQTSHRSTDARVRFYLKPVSEPALPGSALPSELLGKPPGRADADGTRCGTWIRPEGARLDEAVLVAQARAEFLKGARRPRATSKGGQARPQRVVQASGQSWWRPR